MDLTHGTPRYRASTAAVLEFAWDAGIFGADHVMRAVGLTRSTALAALDTLVGLGLVRELENAGGEHGYRLGRPARRFELRADAGLVIGVDAGDRQITAVATDLTGHLVARTLMDALPYYAAPEVPRTDAAPAERQTAVFRAIDDTLAAAGTSRDDVIGVVVGVPAPVDRDGRSPAHQAGFWQHMNADLLSVMAPVFPAVRVENDAALAAIAEHTLGAARGKEHFVAMLSGRRLGSGVFLDGRLVRGAHGGVGELEGLAYVPEVGGTWGLGHLAEEWVRAARADGRLPATHPWGRLSEDELTAETVLAVARRSDPVSAPLVDELGSKLGRICSVIARFHDPDLVVVCGATAGALGEVIEVASLHIADEVELPPPEIVASTLGSDVVSLGAASAARGAALEIILPLFAGRDADDRRVDRRA